MTDLQSGHILGLDQQLNRLESDLLQRLAFAGQGPEAFWTWQQDRMRELRSALLLDMPAVYQVPEFEVTGSTSTNGGRVHAALLRSERDLWLPVDLVVPQSAWRGTCAIALQDGSADHSAVCSNLLTCGWVVLRVHARHVLVQKSIAELSGAYLGVGKTYAGIVALDCIRAVDLLENHDQYAVDQVVVIAAGDMAPIAAAAASLDKRVRGLALFEPVTQTQSDAGAPPMLAGGGGTQLLRTLCCYAPRHLSVDPQLLNPDSKSILSSYYAHAGRPERFQCVDSQASQPEISDYLIHCLDD